MDDFLKGAIELVKAQASVRVMSNLEMEEMIISLSRQLRKADQATPAFHEPHNPDIDAKKSIKEKSITCLECSKLFKVITKKHLLSHGLTLDEYRQKWGLKKETPLVCKALQRSRRNKMKSMRLWEKRMK